MANNKNNLTIKSRKRIFSHLIGEHHSLFSGVGLDFKELREYSSGDDIRHINWKVTAKSMTPAVNIYNEDKQLNVVLVYLNSGSIHFGSYRSKQDVMVEILANLGYATTQKNDMLTTVFFSKDEDMFFKPSKHSKVVDLQIDTAQNIKHLGKTIDYKKLNQYLLSKIKQKSIIFLIGDFLDIGDFKLLGAKHEVNCIIVRDRFEEDLKLLGEFNFVDTNSNDSENIFLDEHSINEYNKLLKAQDNQLFYNLKKANIKYKKIYTDDNILVKLSQLLKG